MSSENSKISVQYPKGLCWDSPIRAAKVSKQHLHLLLTLQDPSDLLGHRVQMQEQPGPEEPSLFFFFQALYNTRGFSCHSVNTPEWHTQRRNMFHPSENPNPCITSIPATSTHPAFFLVAGRGQMQQLILHFRRDSSTCPPPLDP